MTDGRLRASDADRDAVIEILNTAFAAGRITADEHTERTDAALAAKTLGDLTPLTVDLVPQPSPGPQQRPFRDPRAFREQHPFSDQRSRVPDVGFEVITATMSKQERAGVWTVPRRLRLNAFLGTVVLDLTQARLQDRILDIDCALVMSTLKLRVPRGTNVRDGTARILADDSTRQVGPFDENAPLILLSGNRALSEIKVRGPRGQLRDYLGF